MSFTETPRNSCALHGALGTLNAIQGVVPVIHSTSGCGVHYAKAYGSGGGALPQGAIWGDHLSSTNIAEKHVVFGGGSRLREQLKNTVKILDAELYAIVTGCATEIVGDDIAAMAKEGREQGFPVIFTGTPGFRGSFHNGYERVVRSIIEQLPESIKQTESVAQKPLVNIWGILPQQDPFWKGHLDKLSLLVSELGAIPNPLFGINEPLSKWAQVPNAQLNVAVSYWGEGISTWLESIYKTPYVVLPHLPIGPTATEQAALLIAESLKLDISEYIKAAGNRVESFHDAFSSLRSIYFRDGWQRTAAIVGESATAIGIADFLEHYIGIVPLTIIVTDPLPEAAQERIRKAILDRFTFDSPEVLFTEDNEVITRTLTGKPTQLLLGSSLEQPVAEKLRIPFVRIAYPVSDTVIINKGWAGVEGALTLLEDVGTAIRRTYND